MTTTSLGDTQTDAAAREYWRGVLTAGGSTAIPRWATSPATSVMEYQAAVPASVLAALRRLAAELGLPLSSVLLAGHARVLAALSGEPEVVTGYAVADGRPLPCRLSTTAGSWRALLRGTHQAEAELLAHQGFPVAALGRELGSAGPGYETVFDPAGRAEMRSPRAPRCGSAPPRAAAS